MTLLERLRSRTPDWQHPEAEVRARAVHQLGSEERDVLEAMLRDDPDPQVRRAALEKVQDPMVLAERARDDEDESVKDAAEERLLHLAIESREDDVAQASLAAVQQTRRVVQVARSARLEPVCKVALDRLEDATSLASVAKSAHSAKIRHAALERIDALAPLADVAGKSEHKDVAIKALERIDDVGALKGIAIHARNKAAGRRARQRLETIVGAPQPITADERRAVQLALCRKAEKLHGETRLGVVPARLGALREDWRPLQEGADPELSARFEQLTTVLDERVAQHELEQAQRAVREQAERQAEGERQQLCDGVEALVGSAGPEPIEAAEKSWAALETPEGTSFDALDERFAAASRAARSRVEGWKTAETRQARFEEICTELGGEGGVPTRNLRREGQAIIGAGGLPDELTERFRKLVADIEAAEAKQREERAAQTRATKQRLEELCAKTEAMVSAEKLVLGEARALMRQCKEALEETGSLPSKRDRETLQRRLKAARTRLYPKLHEQSAADEWQRWLNLPIQEELCRKIEALLEQEDLNAVTTKMHDIQARWHVARLAPKVEGQALWERYKAALDVLRPRVQKFQDEQKQERAENLKGKLALCEKAEALAESSDWRNTADELKKLQADWKAIGTVPRRDAKKVWERFRKACNAFFERRKDEQKQRRHEWNENLAKKEALCEKAEALATSEDWDAASAEAKALQAEWKTIGPVKKSKSDAVWHRFRTACNAFFDRYKRRHELAREADVQARESVIAELETLAQEAEAAPPEDLAARVLDVNERWKHSPRLPQNAMQALADRFGAARNRAVAASPEAFSGTELDPKASLERMKKLCEKVEGLVSDQEPQSDSAESLAERLQAALAGSAIGGGQAENDRWRVATKEVEAAQASWRRVTFISSDESEALKKRFDAACQAFLARRPKSAGR